MCEQSAVIVNVERTSCRRLYDVVADSSSTPVSQRQTERAVEDVVVYGGPASSSTPVSQRQMERVVEVAESVVVSAVHGTESADGA